MKIFVALMVAVYLFSGTDAGKRFKKCKAEREQLQTQLAELQAENAELLEEVQEEEERTYEAVVGQSHFWPLNSKYGGSNLVNPNAALEMHGVAYSLEGSAEDSLPAYFIGGRESYADILENEAIKLHQSFSFMAKVYRMEKGDGPLFEWDDGKRWSTHIWIWQNKFYVNVIFNDCAYQNMHFSVPVEDNRWYTVGISYNADTKVISMTVDGEEQTKQAAQCQSDLRTSTSGHVNRRLNDNNNRLNAIITCMSMYDVPKSYNEMYEATMPFCKAEE